MVTPGPSTQEVTGDESTDPDALIWHLPVIRSAGEMQLPESMLENDNDDDEVPWMVRGTKGTVRMIGGGAVWWSVVSVVGFCGLLE